MPGFWTWTNNHKETNLIHVQKNWMKMYILKFVLRNKMNEHRFTNSEIFFVYFCWEYDGCYDFQTSDLPYLIISLCVKCFTLNGNILCNTIYQSNFMYNFFFFFDSFFSCVNVWMLHQKYVSGAFFSGHRDGDVATSQVSPKMNGPREVPSTARAAEKTATIESRFTQETKSQTWMSSELTCKILLTR